MVKTKSFFSAVLLEKMTRWELLTRKRECAAYGLSISMYHKVLEDEINNWRRKHMEACENIAKYQNIAEAVAELCVQYNLPSGSPPWMCQLIMSY
jgi:hypothetical protein